MSAKRTFPTFSFGPSKSVPGPDTSPIWLTLDSSPRYMKACQQVTCSPRAGSMSDRVQWQTDRLSRARPPRSDGELRRRAAFLGRRRAAPARGRQRVRRRSQRAARPEDRAPDAALAERLRHDGQVVAPVPGLPAPDADALEPVHCARQACKSPCLRDSQEIRTRLSCTPLLVPVCVPQPSQLRSSRRPKNCRSCKQAGLCGLLGLEGLPLAHALAARRKCSREQWHRSIWLMSSGLAPRSTAPPI